MKWGQLQAGYLPVKDPGPTVFCPPLSMTGPCQGVATAANFTVSHYLYNQKYVSVDICRKSLLCFKISTKKRKSKYQCIDIIFVFIALTSDQKSYIEKWYDRIEMITTHYTCIYLTMVNSNNTCMTTKNLIKFCAMTTLDLWFSDIDIGSECIF